MIIYFVIYSWKNEKLTMQTNFCNFCSIKFHKNVTYRSVSLTRKTRTWQSKPSKSDLFCKTTFCVTFLKLLTSARLHENIVYFSDSKKTHFMNDFELIFFYLLIFKSNLNVNKMNQSSDFIHWLFIPLNEMRKYKQEQISVTQICLSLCDLSV